MQWETKTRINESTWKDLLPSILRRDVQDTDITTIADINIYQGKIYLLLAKNKLKKTIPQIWEFDLEGKLIGKKYIKLDLAQDAIRNDCMVYGYAYISLIPANSTINLIKIDLKNAEIISRADYKTEAQIPSIDSVIADSTGKAIYVAVLDNRVEGGYIYKYTDTDGFVDYYQTKPLHRLNNLRIINNKLLASIKTDSLLEVIDITNTDKPQVLVYDRISFPNWYATDLAFTDDNVNVCFTYAKPNHKNKKDTNSDIMVRKYSPDDKMPQEFLSQGKGTEMFPMMYGLPDGQLVIVGSSTSTRYDRCMRVYATKFKL